MSDYADHMDALANSIAALRIHEVEEAFAKAEELMLNDPSVTAAEWAAFEAKRAKKDEVVALFMRRMEVAGNA
ncbi:MAG TPA: hypothetical protein VGR63_19040 [Casimicrobiaceae bacterium]|jgi:alpha-D-ribose 1-methylphosphonate 5-triphosphate synthase subunit PhnI|nr:hypothetical protein [Casimicrobiaceae bacterium]